MQQIQIKEESLPQRCEVCHQSDCFDSSSNYCSRCKSNVSVLKPEIESNIKNSKITINVAMTAKDYVHALRYHNLHNKFLLISAVPTLLLILFPLISFFRQDGEKQLLGLLILMMPLLILIPLWSFVILFGGYLAYRKLPDFQKDVRFSFSDSGYEISYSKGFAQADWDNLVKTVETSECFILYPQKSLLQIIPKRGFSGTDEIKAIRNLISSKLGKKAKLKID